MGIKPSRGKPLDVGKVGLTRVDLPEIGATPDTSRFDLRAWWPEERRTLPLELEIGSGKGTFLVQQAALAPQINYLGLEYAHAFWKYAADRVRRRGLPNVRMLCIDAGEFVPWYCPDGLFRQVHVYFPDPWPKARHHKRRLIAEPFLRQLHRVLEPTGCVRIVTDHDDYFEWIELHANQVTDLFERQPFDKPAGAEDNEVVGTNFERKYRREGRPFHAMTLRKT